MISTLFFNFYSFENELLGATVRNFMKCALLVCINNNTIATALTETKTGKTHNLHCRKTQRSQDVIIFLQ